jgi:glycosyltransferase involved in cell wall biosynthesis
LPGTGIGVIPDELSGFMIPRWWRYRRWIIKRISTVRRALEGEGIRAPDVVLAFGETNFHAARAVARLFSVPLVFALRNNFVDEVRTVGLLRHRLPLPRALERWLQLRWYLRLERSICRGSDALVLQTDHDRQVILSRNPEASDRAVVIPNSFRVSWLPEALAKANDSRSLEAAIYVGHLNERKGVRYLFEALARLGGRLPFEVVGFGGLEEWCRSYVRDQGLSESVVFHGRQDHPLKLIAGADLLIVPSLFDSFPNTVLEALYAATPVIGSDAPGIVSMLKEPELLFPRGDAGALARRLGELLDAPEEYNRVRRACAERRAAFDFVWAESWLELFRRLVA